MAATTADCGEVRECLHTHVVRFLEGGNYDSNMFDYTVFRLDWVLREKYIFLQVDSFKS